jgi:hypothetical protein
MKRFLNPASKALAVVGVLMLMWTASEMQTAKADGVPVVCLPKQVPNDPNQWYCRSGSCTPVTVCCVRPIIVENGLECCGTFPCQITVINW